MVGWELGTSFISEDRPQQEDQGMGGGQGKGSETSRILFPSPNSASWSSSGNVRASSHWLYLHGNWASSSTEPGGDQARAWTGVWGRWDQGHAHCNPPHSHASYPPLSLVLGLQKEIETYPATLVWGFELAGGRQEQRA